MLVGAGRFVLGWGLCLRPGAYSYRVKRQGKLEQDVEALCRDYGFPDCEEFRWSPVGDAWMCGNLVGDKKWRFLEEVVGLARERKVVVVVAVHDASCPMFSGATEAEMDVAGAFLGCVEKRLAVRKSDGAIMALAESH